MAKMGCAKCGGTKKMAKGGTTKSVSISKPGAGVVKETKGDTNQKMGIYGIAQTGPTGPNDSGIATMKKGGSLKTVPVTKVGLSKLPTVVRNKMGYKKVGGAAKSLPKAQLKTSTGQPRDSSVMKYYDEKKLMDTQYKIAREKTSKDLKSASDQHFKDTVNSSTSKIKSVPTKKKGGVVKSKKK
jgi:hypothetical protein